MNLKRARNENEGFTLIEVTLAAFMTITGLVGLSAVMIPLCRQREQAEATHIVLQNVETILETVRGMSPESVESYADGMTVAPEGVSGSLTGGKAIAVDVDSTNPALIRITITCGWTAGGQAATLTTQSSIYNPKGS